MKKKYDSGNKKQAGMSRRNYLKTTLAGATGLFMFPTIVPSSVFGKNAPSNKINIGQIGFGRIAQSHNLPRTMVNDEARVIAVCDVDTNRMRKGKQFIENWYSENKDRDNYVDVRMYANYRELLAQQDIDAVIISTPDHAHLMPCIEASIAGKDIYMEKPMSLTVEDGRVMSDILHRNGTVFQLGSQQRSINPWFQFKRACEFVRNGRIGSLHTIKVGLPGDPPGGDPAPMPVPDHFNYDAWLGTTPQVPYTEQRVHPQNDFSRPGWLRCEQFSAGMITGWGTHHIDTAHWGMGTEYTGPVEIEAEAHFPTEDPDYKGLWDVHGDFRVEAKYANSVTMIVSGEFPNGIRFEGEGGWVFVSRGSAVTDDEPDPGDTEAPFRASNPALLRSEIGPDEIHLPESEEQHKSWLECIKSRKRTVAPPEVAHRSCTTCLISHIAMKLPRKLYWDPLNERFRNDDEANAMLSRSHRYPYKINMIPGLKKIR